MTIDLVSTLLRGVADGDALGFSNDTCGQSMCRQEVRHEITIAILTPSLRTGLSVVHHKDKGFVGLLAFKPIPLLVSVMSKIIDLPNTVRKDSVGLDQVCRVN